MPTLLKSPTEQSLSFPNLWLELLPHIFHVNKGNGTDRMLNSSADFLSPAKNRIQLWILARTSEWLLVTSDPGATGKFSGIPLEIR